MKIKSIENKNKINTINSDDLVKSDENNYKHADSPCNDQKEQNESAKESPEVKLDPTRYGDWEKNGRCIDF